MPPVTCGVSHPITYQNDITLISALSRALAQPPCARQQHELHVSQVQRPKCLSDQALPTQRNPPEQKAGALGGPSAKTVMSAIRSAPARRTGRHGRREVSPREPLSHAGGRRWKRARISGSSCVIHEASPGQSGAYLQPTGLITAYPRRTRSGRSCPVAVSRRAHGRRPAGRTAPEASRALTPGSSLKRAFASRVRMIRPVSAPCAAMIRSCAPRGAPDRRTCASRRP